MTAPADDELAGTIKSGMVELVSTHPAIMRLAVSQRAKFEGWLKMELAGRLGESGASRVEFEARCQGGRADLAFEARGRSVFVELKTCNTNYRIEGCDPLTRPITKNIQDICGDCGKLRSVLGVGIVAFVMFPLPLGNGTAVRAEYLERMYLERIRSAAGLSRPPEGMFVRITEHAGLKVYAFAVVPAAAPPAQSMQSA